MGFPDIRNVASRIGFLLKSRFAALIAGIDDTDTVRVIRTNANGELNISADIEESPQVEVVNVEDGTVNAGSTTPMTEFVITDPASPTPPKATRRFTIGMKLRGPGSRGNIIIDARTSATGAWQTLYYVPIAEPEVADLSYIPSWARYRAYYKADVNSTGVYFMVLTHPML